MRNKKSISENYQVKRHGMVCYVMPKQELGSRSLWIERWGKDGFIQKS